MADAAAFKAEYPEFLKTEDAQVSAKLAAAETQLSAEVWGTTYAHAVNLLAAHLLAISPWGQQARLSAKDGSSTYLAELERITPQVAHGYGLL